MLNFSIEISRIIVILFDDWLFTTRLIHELLISTPFSIAPIFMFPFVRKVPVSIASFMDGNWS